jgi:4-amino-4-deoxy-L-arabinose transferase-like glycosyltransferase
MKLRLNWIKENWPALAVTGFFLALNLFWIFHDQTYPYWDEADYLSKSFNLWHLLRQGAWLEFAVETVKISAVKPLGISLLPFPFYALLGLSIRSALLALSACLVVFNLAFYSRLAKEYGRPYAFAGLLIINSTPLFVGLARTFFIEMPLMLLTWAFFELLRSSDGLRKNHVPLIIITSLGLLFKISFLYGVAGLVAYYAVHYRAQWRVYGKGLLKIFAFSGLISAPWYLPNLVSLAYFVLRFFTHTQADGFDRTLQTVHNPVNFIFLFANEGTGFWYLLLLAGLVLWLALAARPRLRELWQQDIFASAVVNFLLVYLTIMFFFKYKVPRYAFPVFPFFTLALVALAKTGVAHLRDRNRGGLLGVIPLSISAACALTLVNIANLTFPGMSLPPINLGKFALVAVKHPITYPYRNFKYPIEGILQTILRQDVRHPKRVLLLFDSPAMNCANTQMLNVRDQDGLEIITGTYVFDADPKAVMPLVTGSDFILISAAQDDPAYTNVYTRSRSEYYARQPWLEKIAVFTAPDGKTVEMYFNPQRQEHDLRSEKRKRFDGYVQKAWNFLERFLPGFPGRSGTSRRMNP